MNIPTAINYRGHTIYADGRVYKAGELIAQCKTLAAAKAAATRSQNELIRTRQADHFNTVQAAVTAAIQAGIADYRD